MSTDDDPTVGDPAHYNDEREQAARIFHEAVDLQVTAAKDRAFWGIMGLSYIFNGFAIYGAWTGKLSPWVSWPLIFAAICCLAAMARYVRKR